MASTATVCTELELRLVVPGGPSLPVVAEMRYAAVDPWAVRVSFQVGSGQDGDGTVDWLFARQLLTEGISGTVGDGDVRVWPSVSGRDRVINLAMASPSGAALFEIDRDALVEYLHQTQFVVPTGTEQDVVDLDAELALLLEG